ncbi:MAG: alpha/beta hydrolase [Deltaproteobacteria bacterium]|nr:alpha/beta hydrolase [Deltaproteobacteria bacterium]MBW2116483.1 alpha/beta hydrolase [Deltaproteobacteria bacterium]MBW2344671.1 alpha/beta hydrolase [Deltaproteobacteria bacterium]
MPISGIHLILLILVFIVISCVFFPQIENFFIFYPDKELEFHPADWHLTFEDVYFEAEDKTRLHGWFFPQKGNAPVILFCHGNAGNICHRLENVKLLLDQKFQVFIFDYRGYGQSKGRPSEKGIYRDGLAAYDFLVNRKHIPQDRIVLFGRSLGAAVSIEIALKRKVRSLIIESAFTSTKGMARTMPLFMPFSFFLPPHYNNLEKITGINVPKLIIHGEEDEIVPFSMGQKLYHAARSPKSFYPLKNAGHNDTYVLGGKNYFDTLAVFVRDSKI